MVVARVFRLRTRYYYLYIPSFFFLKVISYSEGIHSYSGLELKLRISVENPKMYVYLNDSKLNVRGVQLQ